MTVASAVTLIGAVTALVVAVAGLLHSVQTRAIVKPAVDAQSARDAAAGATQTGAPPAATR
jgi:hypothetical protein